MLKAGKKAALFALGGGGYVVMELCWRGRSHGSMFLAGGVCFLLIGRLARVKPRLPQPWRCLAGAMIVTMVELAAGLVFNREFQVWDYRSQPGNFLGQICPAFTLAWTAVALGAEWVYGRAEKLLERKVPATEQEQ